MTKRPVPIEYQVARQFAAECDTRGVKPASAGVEGDGIGHAMASVLISEWGPVMTIYSGGGASEMPASQNDMRPSKEVYDRRITELCFTVQEYLKADQLKGLTEDAILQGCAREYKPIGGRFSVEKKEDLQSKIGRSCDDLDAVCILCEVVRQKTGGPSGTFKPKHGDDWKQFARQANDLSDTPRIDDTDDGVPHLVRELAVTSNMDFSAD